MFKVQKFNFSVQFAFYQFLSCEWCLQVLPAHWLGVWFPRTTLTTHLWLWQSDCRLWLTHSPEEWSKKLYLVNTNVYKLLPFPYVLSAETNGGNILYFKPPWIKTYGIYTILQNDKPGIKILFSLRISFWLAVCTQHEKWSGGPLAILVRNSTSLAWAAELFWCKKPQLITWLIYLINRQMYYVIHGKNSNICFIMCHNSTWL